MEQTEDVPVWIVGRKKSDITNFGSVKSLIQQWEKSVPETGMFVPTRTNLKFRVLPKSSPQKLLNFSPVRLAEQESGIPDEIDKMNCDDLPDPLNLEEPANVGISGNLQKEDVDGNQAKSPPVRSASKRLSPREWAAKRRMPADLKPEHVEKRRDSEMTVMQMHHQQPQYEQPVQPQPEQQQVLEHRQPVTQQEQPRTEPQPQQHRQRPEQQQQASTASVIMPAKPQNIRRTRSTDTWQTTSSDSTVSESDYNHKQSVTARPQRSQPTVRSPIPPAPAKRPKSSQRTTRVKNSGMIVTSLPSEAMSPVLVPEVLRSLSSRTGTDSASVSPVSPMTPTLREHVLTPSSMPAIALASIPKLDAQKSVSHVNSRGIPSPRLPPSGYISPRTAADRSRPRTAAERKHVPVPQSVHAMSLGERHALMMAVVSSRESGVTLRQRRKEISLSVRVDSNPTSPTPLSLTSPTSPTASSPMMSPEIPAKPRLRRPSSPMARRWSLPASLSPRSASEVSAPFRRHTTPRAPHKGPSTTMSPDMQKYLTRFDQR